MRASGRRVDPADLPPKLDWEEPVWALFTRISNQWRRSAFGPRYALDMGIGLQLAGQSGWDLNLTAELLGAIETEVLNWDAKNERAK